MRKKVSYLLVICALVLLGNSFLSYASSGRGVAYLPKNCTNTLAKGGITRSGKYSYARVNAESVYPTSDGAEDTYTKCKVVLYYRSIPVSSAKTITEGQKYNITIKDGSLDITTFDLVFAGNDPNLDARVSYWYDGM